MTQEHRTRLDRAEIRAAFLRAVLTLDRGEGRWPSPTAGANSPSGSPVADGDDTDEDEGEPLRTDPASPR